MVRIPSDFATIPLCYHSFMPAQVDVRTSYLPPLKAPRGNELTCKAWPQEAAMRMLMNNLDEEVGERPRDLVVYGGTGKAARNQQSLDAIINSLRSLENDETLLVQSGKPVGVFRTHEYAPRVLIANSNLVDVRDFFLCRRKTFWRRPRRQADRQRRHGRHGRRSASCRHYGRRKLPGN